MVRFSHIETRGAALVAVFVRPSGDTFSLNRESLELRRANILEGKARPDRDVSQENYALDKLTRRERMEAEGVTEEDVAESRSPTHWPT